MDNRAMSATMGFPMRHSRLTRQTRMLAVALAACVLAGGAVSAQATTDVTTLCYSGGFNCVSETGYVGQQTWSEYDAGHNCTNYAAYRLAWDGSADPGNLGDAADWARNAAAKGFQVDGIPSVGSIAQWDAGAAQVGKQGHVGYVEEVNSSDIVVSADAFGGGTSVKRYARAGTYWPSNFIHIGERIAAVTPAGQLLIKHGKLVAPWVSALGADTGAKAVALAPGRIAAITNAGAVVVKEGSLNASWVPVLGADTGAKAIALSGNRIAAITNAGAVVVKEGSLDASWRQVLGADTGARAIALSGNRIAGITNAGAVVVKEGSLDASWVAALGADTGARATALPG